MLVARVAHLTDDADAEILGFIVAASMRGGGTRADLSHRVEEWERAPGARRLRVRSRTERERAHRFYENAGYARIEIQAVFRKLLA
ncbi:MAG: GNAT family N-acetyltransferase [Dokdonella sp.]